jgi:SagB-type dehydrogenase family enzyme
MTARTEPTAPTERSGPTERTRLTERIALRTGVSAAITPDGEVTLVVAHRAERLGRLTPEEHAQLRRLTQPRTPDWTPLVKRLDAGGWLARTLLHDGRPLVTIRPLARPGPPILKGDGEPRLSRFALVRRDGTDLVLECPLATVAVHLHEPSVLALLHDPAHPADDAHRALVDELAGYGFLDTGTEDRDLATRQWSHHDLWFHTRIRYGRHDNPAGGTYWAKGLFEPPRRPGPASDGIPLHRPDPDALDGIIEARRSIREHDPAHPLTAEQLGAFLYRCARVRSAGQDGGQETTDRPYPSGGRLHGLELYPVVSDMSGVPQGMYHYDPVRHRLERLPAPDRPVRRLARQAMASIAASRPPQVLILIAARFGVPMWKYEGIGYSLLLKEVGVLMQTMYLVATAMGLAPCAVGTGDTELFAQATGLPLLELSTVGEFTLGTPLRGEADR